MSEILDQLIPFIWAIIIILPIYAVFHKFTGFLKDKAKATSISKGGGNKKIDEQFDSFIANSPKLLQAVRKEIEEQKDRGVSDDQMKGLIQKKGMLEFLSDNSELIEIFGKPAVKKVLGVLGRI